MAPSLSLALLCLAAATIMMLCAANSPADVGEARTRSRVDAPPRKVLVATVCKSFGGTLDERLADAERVLARASAEAAKQFAGRSLDLVVLPETAIESGRRGGPADAKAKSVPLEGRVLDTFAALARKHRAYLVLPMFRAQGDRCTNVAVLLDRKGEIVGEYAKVHPVGDENGVLEGGVTPGSAFPVFNCDFGKVGLLICWDMGYDDGWAELARGDAEIVAVPTASPQTIRPASMAQRHAYYVVTSTPRDNATIFNPMGAVAAQTTKDEVLVQEIDLSFAILHWSRRLEEGRAMQRAFGDRVGYTYSTREDTGVFWSNDAAMPIGQMMKQLNLKEMRDHLARDEKLQIESRSASK